MNDIRVHRASGGQPPEFASISFPGGRIQVGQFLEALEGRSMSKSAPLPGNLSRDAVREIWMHPKVQAHLRNFQNIPGSRLKSGDWI